MDTPLIIRYFWRRVRRAAVPSLLIVSSLGVAFLGAAWLFGISRSAILGFVPSPIKLAAHGAANQFWLWSIRARDLPYAVYRFRNAGLPVYDLVVSEQALDELDRYFRENEADPTRAKDFKNAKFFADGREYDARGSYRGDEGIHFLYEKKSWRIKFPDENYFDGMKALNLIIPEDRLFLVEEFDSYRARKLGVPAPESRFAMLRLNGQPLGVYWVVEQWGPAMLEKLGLNPDANLYGEVGFGGDIYDNLALWQKYAENPNQSPEDFSELRELFRLIHHPSDEYFWRHVPSLVDMDEFYRWQVLNALAASTHADTVHNARLYFDPTIGKFKFLPWDVYMEPLREWMLPDQGIDFIDYNPLVQRILKNPAYLDARNRVLWECVKDDRELEDDLAFYDRLFKEVRVAFLQDTRKRYPNSFFFSETTRTRNIIKENVRELREMLKKSAVSVLPTMNLPAPENRLTFSPIGLRLDISVKSLAPQELEALTINGVPASAGLVTIYEDANKSGALDPGDRAVWSGRRSEDGTMRAEGLGVVMRGQLETRPEETGFGLGRTWLLENAHRLFVLTGNAPLSSAAVTLDFKNALTGERRSVSGNRMANAALFRRRDDADLDLPSFLRRYPEFIQSGSRAVTLPSGPHFFSETIIFPKGVSLAVAPGASVLLGPSVSLILFGSLRAEGTLAAPISFGRLDPNRPWGTLAVVGAGDTSIVRFGRFDGGSGDYVNGIYTRASLSFFSSPLEFTDSAVTRAAFDDGLNVKNAAVKISRNRFEGNSADAVDLDYVSGTAERNTFRFNGNDGLDISGSRIVIRDNLIVGSGDKGISVGEESHTDLVNNVIADGNIGVAVKDSSAALLLENTVVGNKSGLELYRKKQVFGGAETRVVNSILWGNEREITIDGESRLEVRSSSVSGGWPGEGAVSVMPHFRDPAGRDYRLAAMAENALLLTGGFRGEIGGQVVSWPLSGRIGAEPILR